MYMYVVCIYSSVCLCMYYERNFFLSFPFPSKMMYVQWNANKVSKILDFTLSFSVNVVFKKDIRITRNFGSNFFHAFVLD